MKLFLNILIFFRFFQMDSFSMFEDMYPSADSAVTGIVTLLAAASALGKVKNRIDPSLHKPIMFSFFNGVRN